MKQIIAAIKATIGPVLADAGFLEHERTWIRHRSPFIDCVEIQLRSDSRAYCVNLGVHMDFLPYPTKAVDSASMVQADCELKQRLVETGESDHWWSLDSRNQTLGLLECLIRNGFGFFEQYNELPGSFAAITPENIGEEECLAVFPMMTRVRRILLMAHIYEYVGDSERAVAWARFGTENAGMAVEAKIAFRNIIRKLSP